MGHYFENDETLNHENIRYSFSIFGKEFTLQSDSGVFSKDGLDDGSRLLLETIGKTDLGTNILDLGAGVGPIGLILASLAPNRHVVLADVNDRALNCCRKNAAALGVEQQVEIIHSDVYLNIDTTFSTIVTNPPIRAGKKVTYAMYAGAIPHLENGGRLVIVIRKQQGAESAEAYLKTLFSKVERAAQKKGFRVLIATK
ncbi:MAG: methyltransferase [Candidatus Enteromonas sp.]|nr:methyltransferase [Candidatus Enteromonas sp.]